MTLNKDDFHQFINDLYQVERYCGAYFPKKINHIRYVCINTDYIFMFVIPYLKNF